jgi:hypothetical protein
MADGRIGGGGDQKMGGSMKMRWWGWIGVAIALWSAQAIWGNTVAITSPEASHGQGLSEIGKGIQMLAVTLPRLLAAWMIWTSARAKSN